MIRMGDLVMISLLSLPSSMVAVPAYADGAARISEAIWLNREITLSHSSQMVIFS